MHPPPLMCVVWIASALLLSSVTSSPEGVGTPQVGNGYVATFVNTSDLFLSGVFYGNGSNSQRAPLPSHLRAFVAAAEAPNDGGFRLHETEGIAFYAMSNVETNHSGYTVNATHTWFAHRVMRHVFVEEITITRTGDVVTASKPLHVSLVNYETEADHGGSAEAAVVVLSNTTVTIVPLNHSAAVAFEARQVTYQTQIPEMPSFFGVVMVCEVSAVVPQTLSLAANATSATLTLLSAYCSDAPFDHDDVVTDRLCKCSEDKIVEALTSADTLRSSHVEAWKGLMEYRGLKITPTPAGIESHPPRWEEEGASIDPTVLQSVIDASFYGLFTSLRHDSPYSTSPGGLSTNGYRGHTFWDMETWMMPTLSLFHPDVVRGSPIAYRLHRVTGAEENAAYVVGGAKQNAAAFPWESAFSGYDVCPWPQGEHSEIHITADVVLAWRQFDYLHRHDNTTGGVPFLQSIFPLLNETAHYWLSRCVKDDSKGVWHLNGVTSPDEYHFGNDSVYTNAAVKMAVNYTVEVAELLGFVDSSPEFYAALSDLALHLVVLYDAVNNYHPEFEGYDGTSMVKQADVILLNFPLHFNGGESEGMGPSTITNDLNYYAPRTDPQGPAMTWSMFAVGYLSLGDLSTGYQYFTQGYLNNSFPPFYQWYEVAGGSGCPNFLTGAGGFLQSIWGGLLQLRVAGPSHLVVLPAVNLPSTIQCLEARRMSFAGSLINITLCRSADVTAVPISYDVSVAVDAQGPRVITANGLGLIPGEVSTWHMSGNESLSIATIA